MPRAARSFACLLLLGLLLSPAAASTPTARLVKGPYLQDVTPTSIVVMWQTSAPSDSVVAYGATESCLERATGSAGVTVHAVTLAGLEPDTKYQYRVVSLAGGEGTFRTAPASATPFRFAAYGDTRSRPRVHAAVARGVLASAPRFVLHSGDLGHDGRKDSAWQDEFFTPAEPLLRNVPFYPTLGNHEQNAGLYYEYFSPPPGGGESGKEWYSFDYAGAHFTVLDTDTDYQPGSPQYTWLVDDLKRTTARWKFVMHHHPAFSSSSHGSTQGVMKYLVPLYEQYHVDMVFSGHDHLYERSYKDGVYYIVTGGGGAPLYPAEETPNRFRQLSRSVAHYCTVDVTDTTATLRAVNTDGSVFDTVVLKQGRPAGSRAPAASSRD